MAAKVDGTKIRKLRIREGMTLKDLGDHTARAWRYLGQIERGERSRVTPRTLAALADALGVETTEIISPGELS